MNSDNIPNSTTLYQMPLECCRCVTRQGNDYVRVDRIIETTGTPFVGGTTYQVLKAPICSECLQELRTISRQAARHQRKLYLKVVFITIGVYIAAWILRLAAPSLSYVIVAIGVLALMTILVFITLAALANTRQLRGCKDRLAFWDADRQRVVFQNPEYQAVFNRLNGLS